MNRSISVIVPAYNETARLPDYLAAMRRYLVKDFTQYEVMVVDDGSTDGLGRWLHDLARRWPQLKVRQHPHNRGKGAAVRTGMLAATGDLLLFADADGATPIGEERRLREALDGGADVAIGSRLVRAGDVTRRRSWTRSVIGRSFAGVARQVVRVPVRDPQCGFKMFAKTAGRQIFQRVQESGYLFDLELLVVANRLGYRIVEVPINWSDKPGSRLKMGRDSWRILVGLWRLRRRAAKLRTE